MRARILARKSNPGNRGGLHYSQFRRYLATRASQIQLLAFRPRRENRRPLSPIREVGLNVAAMLQLNGAASTACLKSLCRECEAAFESDNGRSALVAPTGVHAPQPT